MNGRSGATGVTVTRKVGRSNRDRGTNGWERSFHTRCFVLHAMFKFTECLSYYGDGSTEIKLRFFLKITCPLTKDGGDIRKQRACINYFDVANVLRICLEI